MPLQIITEKYNTLNSLYANAGDWVDGVSLFTTIFQAGSGTSNKITYYTQGSNYWLQFDNASWADAGFLEGDIITITATVYANGQNSQAQSWVSTITYINGNELYLNAPLGAYIGGFGTPGNGTTFPLDGILSGMSVVADKLPINTSASLPVLDSASAASMVRLVLESSVPANFAIAHSALKRS